MANRPNWKVLTVGAAIAGLGIAGTGIALADNGSRKTPRHTPFPAKVAMTNVPRS